jgi:hypothetical protein
MFQYIVALAHPSLMTGNRVFLLNQPFRGRDMSVRTRSLIIVFEQDLVENVLLAIRIPYL